MSKKRESKYKPGVGYVSGNRENLAEDSKKVLEDIKDIYESSKLKKNIESGKIGNMKIGNMKIGKYISKKKYSSIELTPTKLGILGIMFLVLLFSGVGMFGVVIIFLLLIALSICK